MLFSHPLWTADVADHNRRTVNDVLRILRMLPPKVSSNAGCIHDAAAVMSQPLVVV